MHNMEFTNERDFKYVMQDVGQVFLGGRMTYDDMIGWEEVPFKLKAIVNKYFMGKEEKSLAETLQVIETQDFRYQILKQLKIKVKAGFYQEKTNRRGEVTKKYISKVYHLDEVICLMKEQEVLTEEFIISKLALLAFSL